ncbi:MAG TPA: hypothetical protein VHN14_36510 [Kofleriaceae bacterium]|nr:hypothetical protein [Kofleriaceae bacterium]
MPRPTPAPPPPLTPPPLIVDHDATTRRVMITLDRRNDSREMTVVRPASLPDNHEESLDVTIRRAPQLRGDPIEPDGNDGNTGATIALPARRAAGSGPRPAGGATASDPGLRDGRGDVKLDTPVRPGVAGVHDGRKRLVGAGANRTGSAGHTPDPRRQR